MNLDELKSLLPLLLPKAISWAEERAAEIAARGRPLNNAELAIARKVGVVHAEKVSVLIVDRLPMPADPLLHDAAIETGLLGPNTVGLTLGYGIYIRDGHYSVRLLLHECRHVRQYEVAGSIADFLPCYLKQIVHLGYDDAPYEIDARAHEIDDSPSLG